MDIPMDLVLEAEKLGFDSVRSSEVYGNDAVTIALLDPGPNYNY